MPGAPAELPLPLQRREVTWGEAQSPLSAQCAHVPVTTLGGWERGGLIHAPSTGCKGNMRSVTGVTPPQAHGERGGKCLCPEDANGPAGRSGLEPAIIMSSHTAGTEGGGGGRSQGTHPLQGT